MQPQANIPNSGQKTVHAYMKVKSFVSPDSPTTKQITSYDKDISDFLATIDNVKRFLNGRNSYAIGNKLYVLIWYLEAIQDEPVNTPFGNADKKVTTEPNKDVQNNSTETEETK
jgi:hypothetical protein